MQRQIRSLLSDQRGATAILFAVAALPIMLLIGAALDFGRLQSMEATLQGIADSAATSAVSVMNEATTGAKMKADAERIAEANLARAGLGSPQVTVNVRTDKNAETRQRTATVTLTTRLPTTLMQLGGIDEMTVSVDATATSGLPKYSDFNFFLDTSDSMGLAATEAARTALKDLSRKHGEGTCEFACHRPRKSKKSLLHIAREAGLTLRIDVAKAGIRQVVAMAEAEAKRDGVENRYSLVAFNSEMRTATKLTKRAKHFEVRLRLIDLGYGAESSLANTTWEKMVPDYLDELEKIEHTSGRSGADRYVVLVTDGLRSQDGGSGYDKLGRKLIRPFDLEQCEAIKAAGYKLAVVYTMYYEIPYNNWYNTHVKPIRPDLGPNLERCASPGLFAVGDTPEEIEAAFGRVFKAMRADPHLTN